MIRAFAIRSVLDASSRLIIFFLNILIARKLTVSDFGILTYALSFANLLYVFTEMGIHTNLLKEVGKNPRMIARLWSVVIPLKFVLSIVVFLTALIFLPYLWTWAHPWIFICALGWMFGNSFLDLYQTFCNALHNFSLAGLLIISSKTILIFGVIILLLINKVKLSNVILIYLFASLLGAVLAGFIFQSATKTEFHWPSLKNSYTFLTQSLPLGLANIFSMIYFHLGTVFLTWLKGSQEVGIYAAANRIFEMVYIVPSILMTVTTPILAQAKENGYFQFKYVLRKLVLFSTVMALAWLIIGFFNSNYIIKLLFGPKYLLAGNVLKVLVIANVIVFFTQIVTYLMVIMERQARHAINQGICLIFNVFFNLILISRWGALGVAVAVILTQFILFSLTVISLRRPILQYANRY